VHDVITVKMQFSGGAVTVSRQSVSGIRPT